MEKALKYYLLSQGKRLRKIHDLTILLQDCMIIDKEFEQFIEQSAKITFYYIESRYPEILPTGTVSKSEAESTYTYAKEILAFVSKKR
ncbi:MAG: HEPN domain-containing protein [Candidatus Roizmanbacteria bacterium]|nr:HEPN domain-containing protein [Candidatus Roizmanbacteria bacterium]